MITKLCKINSAFGPVMISFKQISQGRRYDQDGRMESAINVLLALDKNSYSILCIREIRTHASEVRALKSNSATNL